ncbi:MAG: bifunctional diaminohydroxyphosphoribosylaminopyrimidine deaminase/5-amino-6-(5-phosphoribosylamino)uracil reductase RibD [Cyanobacteria bacterium P01_H01_bin.15]
MNEQSAIGSPRDRELMQRCLTLARKALGKTSPNPLVGAVILKDGEIVGEGFHPRAGEPHAEVFALREAGDKAHGATAYVSLEPCNHFGRTPPCSEALVKAGVSKVVVGMVDPDPRVSGGGIARLRDAGIEVISGVEEADCQVLNEAFVHRVRYRQPFGTLKYAMTLDGKIATSNGHSAWVTGNVAREQVHRLRAATDVVIVGGNTVRLDNPHLTTHDTSDRDPLRLIMTRTMDLPAERHVWDIVEAPTVIATEPGSNPELREQLLKRNVEIVDFSPLTPGAVSDWLYKRQCNSALWECGGKLAAAAIADGCIQKVIAFIAPKIIGGQNAPTPVGEMGLTQMDAALSLERMHCLAIAGDIQCIGYLPQDTWRKGS